MRVIDTNIFVDHLRGFGPAVKFFGSILEAEDVLFSAITEAELVAGKDCSDAKKKDTVLHFLHRWEKVPVTNPVAVMAGDLSRDYGLLIPDAIIAATAILSGAELLTRNTADFEKVPKLRIRAPY